MRGTILSLLVFTSNIAINNSFDKPANKTRSISPIYAIYGVSLPPADEFDYFYTVPITTKTKIVSAGRLTLSYREGRTSVLRQDSYQM